MCKSILKTKALYQLNNSKIVMIDQESPKAPSCWECEPTCQERKQDDVQVMEASGTTQSGRYSQFGLCKSKGQLQKRANL